jgi:predicted RNA-binding Zn-ribbon protein involved in translation (DUF1610 family)
MRRMIEWSRDWPVELRKNPMATYSDTIECPECHNQTLDDTVDSRSCDHWAMCAVCGFKIETVFSIVTGDELRDEREFQAELLDGDDAGVKEFLRACAEYDAHLLHVAEAELCNPVFEDDNLPRK